MNLQKVFLMDSYYLIIITINEKGTSGNSAIVATPKIKNKGFWARLRGDIKKDEAGFDSILFIIIFPIDE